MEVHHNGEWGTVCDNGWHWEDAQVVCRELGFGNPINVTVRAFYGVGRGQIWNLNCAGTERTVADCSYSTWNFYYCDDHYEDAGVKCNSGMHYYYFCFYYCSIHVGTFSYSFYSYL